MLNSYYKMSASNTIKVPSFYFQLPTNDPIQAIALEPIFNKLISFSFN